MFRKIKFWFLEHILHRPIIKITIGEQRLIKAFETEEAFNQFLNELSGQIDREFIKGGDTNI